MKKEKVELESMPCPMGCKINDTHVLNAKDVLYGMPGIFSVVKCQNCGLLRTNPRPTVDSIKQFYPVYYGPFLTDPKYIKNSNDYLDSSFLKLFRKIFNFNNNCIPKLKTGRLLEIGCASGQFLKKMATDGWTVEGIEASEMVGKRCQSLGYKVHIGTLEDSPDPLIPYNLIVGWMVVEHLHDPVLSLTKIKKWIKPDGWLVISVPNIEVVEYKIFKNSWYALQLPTHLYHFTPKTIENLLDKSGWEVKKIYHQRILFNLLHSIRIKIKKSRPESLIVRFISWFIKLGVLANIILYPFALILSFFKQTGRITIWAQLKK